MLSEIAVDLIQRLWAFLLNSWLPMGLSVVAGALLLWRRPGAKALSMPGAALGLAEILAIITWCFLYAEHLSPSRIPVFDYGAPALALVSLLALPVLGIVAGRHWRDLVASRGALRLVAVTFPLLSLSLIPGVFLVWFYTAMACSGR